MKYNIHNRRVPVVRNLKNYPIFYNRKYYTKSYKSFNNYSVGLSDDQRKELGIYRNIRNYTNKRKYKKRNNQNEFQENRNNQNEFQENRNNQNEFQKNRNNQNEFQENRNNQNVNNLNVDNQNTNVIKKEVREIKKNLELKELDDINNKAIKMITDMNLDKTSISDHIKNVNEIIKKEKEDKEKQLEKNKKQLEIKKDKHVLNNNIIPNKMNNLTEEELKNMNYSIINNPTYTETDYTQNNLLSLQAKIDKNKGKDNWKDDKILTNEINEYGNLHNVIDESPNITISNSTFYRQVDNLNNNDDAEIKKIVKEVKSHDKMSKIIYDDDDDKHYKYVTPYSDEQLDEYQRNYQIRSQQTKIKMEQDKLIKKQKHDALLDPYKLTREEFFDKPSNTFDVTKYYTNLEREHTEKLKNNTSSNLSTQLNKRKIKPIYDDNYRYNWGDLTKNKHGDKFFNKDYPE